MLEKPRISAIAAIGRNRELGKDNDLIWKFDADFARMKELIHGHTLVMGRKTYESIGRELSCPSVVITSDDTYKSPYENPKHTYIATSLEEALQTAMTIENNNAANNKEVFIFGGSRVYTDALPQTERIYLTKINDENSAADAFFPEYTNFTKIIESSQHAESGIDFTLLTLER